ncbi:MAG: right-handed parallel beta-helix repeat-containing protein [Verrucomicrobia bacterium]|nr:right-handed parallel beta-helix repeat-containing protein [Verrucomicrobiota bacterium]
MLARTRIYGFVMQNVSHVSLKGLYLHGASIHVNGGSHNTVDGCHVRHVSPWGNAKGPARFATSWGSTEDGTTGLCLAGTNHTVKDCSLVGGWGSGIRLEGNDLTVRNNYLADFGWFGRWLAAPISGFGTRLRIENNTIKRSGGCGIALVQKNPGDGANVNHVRNPTIRHNDIRDVAYLLMDGASFIYINNDDVPSADRRLDGEIAFNVGVGLRSRSTDKFFWGIYIDNGADFVTLHHNVIHSLNPNTAGAGIFLHGAQHKQENIFVYHNTIWGNFANAISSHTWGKGSISNVVFQNNLAQKAGFRATAIGGVTASHNREHVLESEFVDMANSNFRLKPGSASINAGAVIPGLNDAASSSPFAGSAPDLGAYESGGKDWTVGSTVTPPIFP